MSESSEPPRHPHDPEAAGWGPGPGAPAAQPPPLEAPAGWARPDGWAPDPQDRFARPDPATVAGPPWPTLVAVGSYAPPRMIRWPVAAGLALLAAYVIALLVITSSTSISHAAWLADHDGTINTLNRDQQNLAADNPANGGNASQWLNDWITFHRDVAGAASLPNPGGSATAPWREMINDYFNGSAEIIQAINTQNATLVPQAERDLQAGNKASARFNSAMGISSP